MTLAELKAAADALPKVTHAVVVIHPDDAAALPREIIAKLGSAVRLVVSPLATKGKPVPLPASAVASRL